MAQHGGRDPQGGRHEVRQEPVVQNRLSSAQVSVKQRELTIRVYVNAVSINYQAKF